MQLITVILTFNRRFFNRLPVRIQFHNDVATAQHTRKQKDGESGERANCVPGRQTGSRTFSARGFLHGLQPGVLFRSIKLSPSDQFKLIILQFVS
jgi:hypothetical protein